MHFSCVPQAGLMSSCPRSMNATSSAKRTCTPDGYPRTPVGNVLPSENAQLRTEGWRWHDEASVLSFFAAFYQCPIDRINPVPVRVTVPAGDGYYCLGNPWEVVLLYRWFGQRKDDSTVPPLPLQRLWCLESPRDGDHRFLYRSFLPRVQARLLRSSRHRSAALSWFPDVNVTVNLTAGSDVRRRMPWLLPLCCRRRPDIRPHPCRRHPPDATSSSPLDLSGGSGVPSIRNGGPSFRTSGGRPRIVFPALVRWR